MDQLLDLGQVARGDRHRRWHETIRANYLDLDIRFAGNASPTGVIAQSHLGAMTFAAFESAPQVHERTATCLDDDVDHLFAWMQFRGNLTFDQCGREVEIGPGCFVIMDAAEAYRASFHDDYQAFGIKIPRALFGGPSASKRDIVNVCVDSHEGSMVIVDYFRRMARNFVHIDEHQRLLMGTHGIKLILEMVTAKV